MILYNATTAKSVAAGSSLVGSAGSLRHEVMNMNINNKTFDSLHCVFLLGIASQLGFERSTRDFPTSFITSSYFLQFHAQYRRFKDINIGHLEMKLPS